MTQKKLIQLFGTSDTPLGLYLYDPDKFSAEDAIQAIESAIETAFQKKEDGELDAVDVQTEADEELEKIGIERTNAEQAFTERL